MMQQLFDISLKIEQFRHWCAKQQVMTQYCMLCTAQADNAGICKPCLADMPWHDMPKCHICNLPSNHSICGACLKAPPYFDRTSSVFRYDYPLNHLIQAYKYQEALHISVFFATQLLQIITHQYAKDERLKPNVDLIIPMPMHSNRLKERGFNQALEIAKVLSKQLDIPLDYTSCERIINAPPQASLPLKKRKANVAGVFACSQSLDDLNIAIIDDVMTTGASVNELAHTLKNAGAAHVTCWVIARTLPSSNTRKISPL
jgi:ComF family protein